MKAFGTVVAGLLIVVAVTVGGWQLGWWLRAENTDRQVEIDNRNTGTQTAWADQAKQNIIDIGFLPEGATAQRGLLVQDTCDLIGRLVDSYVTDTLYSFQTENC